MDIKDIDKEILVVRGAAKIAEHISDDPKVVEAAKTVGNVAGKAKAVKAVTAAGAAGVTVAGASGAGIMTTLATAGAAVGGGVVAGVGIVAGAAGAGTAKLLNETVFDENKDAQKGTYAGAAVGTLGSLGALAVAGAGPTGLATIGRSE